MGAAASAQNVEAMLSGADSATDRADCAQALLPISSCCEFSEPGHLLSPRPGDPDSSFPGSGHGGRDGGLDTASRAPMPRLAPTILPFSPPAMSACREARVGDKNDCDSALLGTRSSTQRWQETVAPPSQPHAGPHEAQPATRNRAPARGVARGERPDGARLLPPRVVRDHEARQAEQQAYLPRIQHQMHPFAAGRPAAVHLGLPKAQDDRSESPTAPRWETHENGHEQFETAAEAGTYYRALAKEKMSRPVHFRAKLRHKPSSPRRAFWLI